MRIHIDESDLEGDTIKPLLQMTEATRAVNVYTPTVEEIFTGAVVFEVQTKAELDVFCELLKAHLRK